MARACFPNVSQFPIRETLFPESVFVSKVQIMRTLHGTEFNENPSMRALAKNLRARASEHSSIFCEQFEQRPNFASTFKLDGTIRYPYCYIKYLLSFWWCVSYLCTPRRAASAAADCFHCPLLAGLPHPPTSFAVFLCHHHCAWPEDPP